MRLIYLSTPWTILLDTLAWLILQPLISYLVTRIPIYFFDPSAWPYRTFPWEDSGNLYERLFRVRRWKHKLPSGGTVFGGFSMASLSAFDEQFLDRYARETCRAELAHWLQAAMVPLFFLWNPPSAVGMMTIYAVGINLPCIISQRYNRPRLQRILQRVRRQET